MNDYQSQRYRRHLSERGVPIYLDDVKENSAGVEAFAEFDEAIRKEGAKQGKLDAVAFDAFVKGAEAFSTGLNESENVQRVAETRDAAHTHAGKLEGLVEAARPAATDYAGGLRASGREKMLEGLALFREGADEDAHGRAIKSLSANDDRGARRQSRGYKTPPPLGGKFLDQLELTLREQHEPEAYYLDGGQLRRWQQGEPATDIFGDPVPADARPSKVRMCYGGARDVGVPRIENA